MLSKKATEEYLAIMRKYGTNSTDEEKIAEAVALINFYVGLRDIKRLRRNLKQRMAAQAKRKLILGREKYDHA